MRAWRACTQIPKRKHQWYCNVFGSKANVYFVWHCAATKRSQSLNSWDRSHYLYIIRLKSWMYSVAVKNKWPNLSLASGRLPTTAVQRHTKFKFFVWSTSYSSITMVMFYSLMYVCPMNKHNTWCWQYRCPFMHLHTYWYTLPYIGESPLLL